MPLGPCQSSSLVSAFSNCLLPLALEVDGVGEDQAGVGVDEVSLDQLLDLLTGLVADPGVDRPHRLVRLGTEVDLVEGPVVEVGDGLLEVGLEAVALLPPQGVGRDQLERAVAFAVDRLQQPGVLAVLLIDAFGCADQVGQHPACLAPCAHGAHGERHPDAERRQEQVLARLRARQLVVQAGGEIAADGCCRVHTALAPLRPGCQNLQVTRSNSCKSSRNSTLCQADLLRSAQNMPLLLADCSGTVWSTSQCSTTLPSSSSRKMSMPAQSGRPGHT